MQIKIRSNGTSFTNTMTKLILITFIGVSDHYNFAKHGCSLPILYLDKLFIPIAHKKQDTPDKK
jgi:hypothetical protein